MDAYTVDIAVRRISRALESYQRRSNKGETERLALISKVERALYESFVLWDGAHLLDDVLLSADQFRTLRYIKQADASSGVEAAYLRQLVYVDADTEATADDGNRLARWIEYGLDITDETAGSKPRRTKDRRRQEARVRILSVLAAVALNMMAERRGDEELLRLTGHVLRTIPEQPPIER